MAADSAGVFDKLDITRHNYRDKHHSWNQRPVAAETRRNQKEQKQFTTKELMQAIVENPIDLRILTELSCD
jgi:hypothetical protein